MPNTNPCPTCHSQLDPGTPHTFCARTKEPKARELAMRIDDVVYSMSVVEAEMHDRIKALENLALNATYLRLDTFQDAHGRMIARLEALERDRSARGALATKLEDLAYEHADKLTITELRDLFDMAANHENGVGGNEPKGAVAQSIVNSDGTSAPADSALPMPERPPWLSSVTENSSYSVTPHGVRQVLEWLRVVESRLAEARHDREGTMYVLAQTEADRDALKAKLAEADKALGGYKADNASLRKTTAEAVERAARLKLERDGNVWIWERDADNEVESLVCPVLIQADALRAIIADRDVLRAKLAEWESACRDAFACDDEAPTEPKDIARLAKAHAIEARAKLDGVREALSDAISTVGGARVSCVGDHYIHSPQVRLDQVSRWRSALAAAENTNTVDAARRNDVHASEVRADRLQESPDNARVPERGSTTAPRQADTRSVVNGEEPQAGAGPAIHHPSPATEFEMTAGQRESLSDAMLDWDALQHVAAVPQAASWIESLVRSELRKAREGWVTREVALTAMERWGTNRHADALCHARKVCMSEDTLDGMLDSAIRAASKGAGGG